MLDIHVAGLERATLVEVHGRVDSMTANQFGEAIMSPINDGQVNIILDLAGVDFMSSAGLREIVVALKKAKRASGDLRIVQPTERVMEVFEMAGIDTIVQIFPTRVDAVASY